MAPINFKPLTLDSVSFSLTDGTDIPPPPPSPPPVAKSTPNGALSSHPTTPTKDAASSSSTTTSSTEKAKQQLPPQSPTSTTYSQKRPSSSVRKLLSLRSLRENKDSNRTSQYLLHSPTSTTASSRPGSPYTTTTIESASHGSNSAPSLSRKRSSGWFGSRRKSGIFNAGGDGSIVPASHSMTNNKKGPPPPMIPELQEFASLDGALSGGQFLKGEDLFKNIK